MANSIPISSLDSVTPAVISAGNGINGLSGLIISAATNIPDRTVRSYTSASAVGSDFGTNSAEYAMAQVYFTGVSTALMAPATLYVAGHSGSAGLSSSYMEAIIQQAPFRMFCATFNVSLVERQALAQWANGKNSQYWFISWDNDSTAANQGDTASFGAWLSSQSLSGTTAIYDTTPLAAAMAMAWAASLDFTALNGRSTLAFRSSPYVVPAVTDLTTAENLLQNGYNFYGNYANGYSGWQFFQNGSVSGKFLWADSYVNQIWMNANLQANLVDLQKNTGQIPFNVEGDNLIAASVQGTISQALNFGAIRSGVTLSTSQIQQINSLTGTTTAANTLQTRGWYLIPGASTASPTIRQARGPIRPVFLYTDGQSVQSINMVSVEVQ